RTHLRFFTLHTIRDLFESTGYRVERVVEKRSYSALGKTLGALSLGQLHKFLTVQYVILARPA
ncbi:MAG: class I SAM-dependent methyltransferase, partial [Bacteroidota bacterium]